MDFLDTNIPIVEMVARLAIAALCGMAIGWEREAQRQEAGLRTHMLVGLGSAAFMVAILELSISGDGGRSASVDPSRVYQGLIGGIGFIGAGAIIQSRGNVHGLSTGAGIWIVGAIGVACGQGAYVLAVIVTAMAVFVLLVCRLFAKPMIREITDDPDEKNQDKKE